GVVLLIQALLATHSTINIARGEKKK
ncbi:hypothetical protein CCACVL1_25815, partial [Corchorus capsularis]